MSIAAGPSARLPAPVSALSPHLLPSPHLLFLGLREAREPVRGEGFHTAIADRLRRGIRSRSARIAERWAGSRSRQRTQSASVTCSVSSGMLPPLWVGPCRAHSLGDEYTPLVALRAGTNRDEARSFSERPPTRSRRPSLTPQCPHPRLGRPFSSVQSNTGSAARHDDIITWEPQL
jgi:hypothetical protein